MKLYQAEFTLPHDCISYFTENLEEQVTAEEISEDSPIWRMRIIYNEKPDKKKLRESISNLASSMNLPCPKIEISEIEDKNWVEENQKSFPPISTERFHIYSEFSSPAKDRENIQISPGTAFGTGQHETTYLCLEAISWLFDGGYQFSHVLDLGCGSGILAIAAAKTWREAEVVASDNDEVAIKVTDENAAINHVKIKTILSDGFKKFVQQQSSSGLTLEERLVAKPLLTKFDLVVANILLNPLLEMAGDIGKHSENVIVLSGFKSDQFDQIIQRYSVEEFTPLRIFAKNHWVAAVLTKM